MAVTESTLVVGPLVPDEGVTTISLDFFFERAEWLEVYKGGSTSPLTLSADYSVSGEGTTQGVITLSEAADGETPYAVYLVVPLERDSDFSPRADLRSRTVNQELDRLVQGVQGVRTLAESSFRVSRTTPTPDPMHAPDEAARADRFVQFSADGKSLEAIRTGQGFDESEAEAKAARDAAQDAEGGAVSARDRAQEWAENPEDAPVEAGEFSALHWAAKAAQSAALSNRVIYVDTIADLQALDTAPLPDGQQVSVSDHDTGGVYRYDESADSGGVMPSSGAGRWFLVTANDQGRAYVTRSGFVEAVAAGYEPAPGTIVAAGGVQYKASEGVDAIEDLPGWVPYGVLTPQHWGAVGDGVHDDHDAFEGAAAYIADIGFGVLRVPAGNYIKGTTTVLHDGFHVYGAGRGATTITLRGNTEENTGPCWNFGGIIGDSTAFPVKNCSVRGMTIDGNKANQKNGTEGSDGGNFGIRVNRTDGSMVFEDLNIFDTDGYGIGLVGTNQSPRRDIWIRDVSISGAHYDGIDVKAGVHNLHFENLVILDCGGGPRVPLTNNLASLDIRGNHVTARNIYASNIQSGGSDGAIIRIRSDVGDENFEGEVVLENIWAFGPANEVIRISGPQLGVAKLKDVFAYGGDADGVRIVTAKHIYLDNVWSYDAGRDGVSVSSAAGLETLNVTGGGVTGSGRNALRNSCPDCIVTVKGFNGDGAGESGILNNADASIHIDGCRVVNSTGPGIDFNGIENGKWSIKNTVSTDTRETDKTQTGGIRFGSSISVPGRIQDCDLTGNDTGPFIGSAIPINTEVVNVSGYRTFQRVSGLRTVSGSSGSVALEIDHEFGRVPNINCVYPRLVRETAVNDYEVTTLRVQSVTSTVVRISSRVPDLSSTSDADVRIVVDIDERVTP